MVDQIRYVDRSRIVTDWSCPRKRYLGYEYEGRGLSPDVTSLELFLGTTIHDSLARIADTHQIGEVPIGSIADEAARGVIETLMQVQPGEVPGEEQVVFAREQAALIEGLVRGFHRHVWPRMLPEGWKIVAVEKEMIYRVTPQIHFMSKPDLIIADPEDVWVYVEHKSTANKKQAWIDSWSTAVQLHSGVRAVEEMLGQAPQIITVSGLYKGYESYGKQSSPFCYAYVRSGTPPFSQDQIQYEYKAGFRRQPTWEMPGGVREWVERMPENVLADQFPQTAPIFVKEELVDSFFRQVKDREERIAAALPHLDDERVLDQVFPQHFDQCQPTWGRRCQFYQLCHGRVENPLEQGFTYRVPHHSPELDAFVEKYNETPG